MVDTPAVPAFSCFALIADQFLMARADAENAGDSLPYLRFRGILVFGKKCRHGYQIGGGAVAATGKTILPKRGFETGDDFASIVDIPFNMIEIA